MDLWLFYADWEHNSHRFLSQYCVGNDCDYLLGNKEPTESSARFRVYPNPAASHVRIDLADPAGSNHRFRITDSLGKIYLDEGFPHGASTHTVSVADWPTGVYSVQYLADGALWGAKPVVVFR
ncbi:MAG: T9SS type A sorting domain-containing protein [Saprospirales bacterium]|nr:T9SS type A sorting domain-containing protein [Saprospirales bacterium]